MLLTFYNTLERPKKNVNVLAFSLQGGVQKSVAGLLSWAPIQFTSFANKSQKKCRLMADSWGGGSRQNPGGLVECEKSSIARILHQTFTWPFSSVRFFIFFFVAFQASKRSYSQRLRSNFESGGLQTIPMKFVLLCVWAEWAVLGSAKTTLKFKYEI